MAHLYEGKKLMVIKKDIKSSLTYNLGDLLTIAVKILDILVLGTLLGVILFTTAAVLAAKVVTIPAMALAKVSGITKELARVLSEEISDKYKG